jgi:hypothetical protein
LGKARLTPTLLEAAPIALVAALSAWAFWDFLGIPKSVIAELFTGILLLGLAALVLGLRFRVASFRRAGLVLVTLSYLAAHLFVLPLDPAAALGFLTLVLVAVEIRIVAERFAPVLRADLDEDAREHVHDALSRSLLRVAAASALGFLGSTLTADLALSGSLPLRTIATALVLSLALIAVVLLLAFWPFVEARLGAPGSPEAPIQTPK